MNSLCVLYSLLSDCALSCTPHAQTASVHCEVGGMSHTDYQVSTTLQSNLTRLSCKCSVDNRGSAPLPQQGLNCTLVLTDCYSL